MKIIKLSFFVFPLLISSLLMATANQQDEDITNPGTGTFSVEEDSQQEMQATEQLEMEKEEAELDSFGEDTYNRNVDPDSSQDEDAE